MLHIATSDFPAEGTSEDTFMGTISSDVLMEILKHPTATHYVTRDVIEDHDKRAAIPLLDYESVQDTHGGSVGSERHTEPWKGLLKSYISEPKYEHLYVDLAPYTNTSAFSVQSTFSLQTTYTLFRAMGLRHLTVLTRFSKVHGILTRKDLMGFQIDHKLADLVDEIRSKGQGKADRSDLAAGLSENTPLTAGVSSSRREDGSSRV